MTAPRLDDRFYWRPAGPHGWMLMWDGLLCGTVAPDGSWRVDWRGRRAAGRLQSVRLARKMMERWFAARQALPPRNKRARRSEMTHFAFGTEQFLQGWPQLLTSDDELLF